MKKIILSIAAVAALAACTKSEVQYEQPGEIGFVPVTKMNTKAAVADNNYPRGLDLFIFANAGDGADVSAYTPYFRNGQFKHKEGGVFSGNPTPYYWPNVKKLIFSGYSNSGNANDVNPEYEYFSGGDGKPAEWQIKINGYVPGKGTTAKGDNDLMWFPTTDAVGKADKGTGQELNDGNVDVVMKHACAWVTIKMKGNGVTAGTSPWNIKKIDMLSLSQSGNVTLGTTATWSSLAEGTVMNIYAKEAGRPLTIGGEDYTTNLETGASKVYDLVVIPQAPKTLQVSYSFVSQAASGTTPAIVIDEMIDIPLATTTTTAWDPGKHYTYTITLTAEEILVEPTVNTWVDEPEEEIEFQTV